MIHFDSSFDNEKLILKSIMHYDMDFFTMNCAPITMDSNSVARAKFVSISNGIMCCTINKIGVIQMFI